MRSHSLAFLVAIIVALFSINTYASTVVYTQAPNTNSYAGSTVQNITGDPGFNWGNDATDQQAWEYFGVVSNVSFDRIGWYGTNADGEFAVDLFSATCFSCGATSVNGNGTFTHGITTYNSDTLLPNPGPFSQAQVHKTLVSGSLYSYYIDLTSTLTLDHTKTYALSIVNNYSTLPFAWALSNTGGPHVQYLMTGSGSYMFLRSPGDLAFTLTNTAVSAVPAPAAAWLMLMGLMTVLGINCRRKTHIAM